MYPIFISYRRSDLSLEAEWIYNVISTFFGKDIVFFDRQEIEAGKRWDDTLHTCISSAYIVLILIGPKWLKEQLESGRRRLDDPEDWVRKEVIAAITNYKNNPAQRWIFSVLLNEASQPKQQYLPEELKELSSFQIEKKLQFNISNYLETAGDLYIFINEQLSKVSKLGLIKEIETIPFDRNKVPNPYELPEYQLPEELRLSRPKAPFKGLEYFTRGDARIFFGRKKEIGEIIDYFKKSQNIIRLYGQSGVGKSSLLFAGLLPRLEEKGWNIKYFRRSVKIAPNKNLATFVEEQQNFPLQHSVVILDQLEEMITNPNNEENEIDNLSLEILNLVKVNVTRRSNPIRLILCYRKEYDVEIRTTLHKNLINSNEYWLKDLSEIGMKEAITGITKNGDLTDHYHLEIEKELDNLIVTELLNTSVKENVTPLLQILLRKMWDRVSEKNIESRRFTKEIYDECKSKDLQQLLQEQLQAVAIREMDLQETIASGLGLDVLKCFVTEADTSAVESEVDIISRYDDELLIKKLLQFLVDVYLLVRLEKRLYRIPHDSLAKAVRIQYSNSQLPGQRAARLLDSKWQDIEARDHVEFSKPDLIIIESGKTGMRKFTGGEKEVIEESRLRIQNHEIELEEKNKQLELALSGNRAKALAATSRQLVSTDPTIAVRLAEAACKATISPSNEAQSAFVDVLRQTSIFYKQSFEGHTDSIHSVTFSPNGQYVLTGSNDGTARLWNLNGTLKQSFEGHTSDISSVAFSPDGQYVLTGSWDFTARLWSLNGTLMQLFKGHTSWIFTVAFSPDGQHVLTGGHDNTTKLWNLHGTLLQSFVKHVGAINSVCFSPDGQYLLTASHDKTAKLWDLNGNMKQSFKGHSGSVLSVVFSPEGKYVLTGSSDNTAKLWNRNGTLKQSFIGHAGSIYAVTFSPDGKYVLTGSNDKTARIWNLDGTLKQSFEGLSSHIYSLAFSKDARFVLIGGKNHKVKLWNLEGILKQSFEVQQYSIFSVMFSPDGKYILTRCTDSTVKLWNLNGTLIRSFKGHKDFIYSATFSTDSQYILTASNDKTAKLWNLDGTLQQTFELIGNAFSSVSFSPDGQYVMTGRSDHTAKLWNLDGTLKQSFEGHTGSIDTVTFSSDGQHILTSSLDSTVKLWNLNGTLKQTFEGHQYPVISVVFSPDGQSVLEVSTGTVKLWNMDGTLTQSFEKEAAFGFLQTFTPDGNFILTLSDSIVMLWDLDGTLKQTFKGHTGYIASIAFSPDGQYILTGSHDKTAKLWNFCGMMQQSFEGHSQSVNSASFSPDGQYVLTGSDDGTAKLWNPFWTFLNPENIYVPSAIEMKDYDIPEDIKWGKKW